MSRAIYRAQYVCWLLITDTYAPDGALACTAADSVSTAKRGMTGASFILADDKVLLLAAFRNHANAV